MSHRAVVLGAILTIVCAGPAAAQTRTPASALIITNARALHATDVTVRVGQGAVSLARPLAPGAKATLRLPKMTDCIVSVRATFVDGGEVDVEEFDVCQEKTIRFTEKGVPSNHLRGSLHRESATSGVWFASNA